VTEFVPQWSEWRALEDLQDPRRNPEGTPQATCKTCKSPSAGFAGAVDGHSQRDRLTLGGVTVDAPSQDSDPGEAERQRLKDMDLATFASAEIIVRVHSKVLGCDVLFVSDNVPAGALAGHQLPIYRASELCNLAILRPQPRSLRYLHEVKTVFHGEITDVQSRDDRTQS